MREEKKDNKMNEVYKSQLTFRRNGSINAGIKAMDMGIKNTLKQGDILFVINGFIITLAKFATVYKNVLSVVLFLVLLIGVAIQSGLVRRGRNIINNLFVSYLSKNSIILSDSSHKLFEQLEEKEKSLEGFTKAVLLNNEKVDTLKDDYEGKISKAIKNQNIYLYNVTLVFVLLLLFMFLIKFFC